MSAIDTRGLKRDSLFFFAELLPEGGTAPEKVKVRNLSDAGMMLDATLMLKRGDRVSVKLRNIGLVTGRVAWTQGSRIGIAFEQTIDARSARQALQQGGGEAPRYARPAVAPANTGWNVRPL